jgi:hypothetical protein
MNGQPDETVVRLSDVDAEHDHSWPAENTPLTREEAAKASSEIFDEAIRAAKLTNKEVAHLLGCSASLVMKMRSPEDRATVSFAQMLRLPLTFHIELHRAMNRRYGFGRAALARLVEAIGDIVVLMPPGGYRRPFMPWGEGVE